MNGWTLCDFPSVCYMNVHSMCKQAYLPLNVAVLVVCACIVRASFALTGEETGGGVRSVTLPTERAFILGLSEPTQGEIAGC